ncbi:hypothetical protein, partial [Streptomyces sp. NPDC058418]
GRASTAAACSQHRRSVSAVSAMATSRRACGRTGASSAAARAAAVPAS